MDGLMAAMSFLIIVIGSSNRTCDDQVVMMFDYLRLIYMNNNRI